MLFTMLRNVSATGMNHSVHILKRNALKARHYNVALSHATKKLLRTIFAMEKSGQAYISPVSLSL